MCFIRRYLKRLEIQRRQKFNEYIDYVHQEVEKMVRKELT